jgi:hypothetical protein
MKPLGGGRRSGSVHRSFYLFSKTEAALATRRKLARGEPTPGALLQKRRFPIIRVVPRGRGLLPSHFSVEFAWRRRRAAQCDLEVTWFVWLRPVC